MGMLVRTTTMTNWTYFNDIYFDKSLARVVLCNASSYSNCTVREPQIPSAWSNTSITTTVNLGALPESGTAYLYVVAPDGSVNSQGHPIVIGGGVAMTPPAGPSTLSVH